MSRRVGLTVVIACALAGSGVVLLGDVEEESIDFGSVLEMWGDVLRDVDEVGLRLTRVSHEEEMRLGRDLAGSFSLARADAALDSYARSVGENLVPYARRKRIQYAFHVVEAGSVVNAFALPGGHVFVTRGMLEFVRSEAELAAVLGHEIAHVDARHCVARYQYALRLRKAGLEELEPAVALAHFLIAVGYTRYQEIEADAQGLRMAIQASYDPEAAVLFRRMKEKFREPEPSRSTNPVDEVKRAAAGAFGSYFKSHPPWADRARRLDGLISRNQRRLSGRDLYVGTLNHQRRIGSSVQQFPGETRRH